MFKLSTTLGWTIGIVTRGRKKFTWSKQWESLSTLGGQLMGHLENPKTSFPLKCGTW
jgi:hypothetical protein